LNQDPVRAAIDAVSSSLSSEREQALRLLEQANEESGDDGGE